MLIWVTPAEGGAGSARVEGRVGSVCVECRAKLA